ALLGRTIPPHRPPSLGLGGRAVLCRALIHNDGEAGWLAYSALSRTLPSDCTQRGGGVDDSRWLPRRPSTFTRGKRLLPASGASSCAAGVCYRFGLATFRRKIPTPISGKSGS